MLEGSYLYLIKCLVIAALIFVMTLGAVAFTPRYIFWGYSDAGCCDAGTGYDWLGILVVVPFVVGVALAMAVLKSWLDDRATKTRHRLL